MAKVKCHLCSKKSDGNICPRCGANLLNRAEEQLILRTSGYLGEKNWKSCFIILTNKRFILCRKNRVGVACPGKDFYYLEDIISVNKHTQGESKGFWSVRTKDDVWHFPIMFDKHKVWEETLGNMYNESDIDFASFELSN